MLLRGGAASAEGEPARVSICHCDVCKRRTGSAFAHNSTWPEDAVSIAGETRQVSRTGENGGTLTGEVCPSCGSMIAYCIAARPKMISIPVGAFAGVAFPPPHAEVFGEQAEPWLGKILPEAAQE